MIHTINITLAHRHHTLLDYLVYFTEATFAE